MSLKHAPSSKAKEIIDSIQKWFIVNIKGKFVLILGFNPEEMCLCTVLFEGSADLVEFQKKTVFSLSEKYKGLQHLIL